MKIISKYKDFYDFIVQDHDADLTYIRQIGIVTENFDNLFNKDQKQKNLLKKVYERFDQ